MRGYKVISFEQFCQMSNCRGHVKYPNGMYRCLGPYCRRYCRGGDCIKWRNLSRPDIRVEKVKLRQDFINQSKDLLH